MPARSASAAAMAARARSALRRAREGAGAVCSRRPRRSSASAHPTSARCADIDIASCIPIAARAHVLLERSEPEHRTITAAFIDLMDTDELLERLGPERLAAGARRAHLRDPGGRAQVRGAVLRDRRRQGQRQGAAHGGRPVEHGPGRGADAAGAAGDHGPPGLVPMRDRREHRQGLHRRLRAALPPRLSRVRRRDQHRCARHEQADAGQILSTEIVLERSRTAFETTPIEPFKAKGKAALVRASRRGPDRRGPGRARGRDAAARPRRRARGTARRPRARSSGRGLDRRDQRRRRGSGKSRLVAGARRSRAATPSSSTRGARSTSPRRRTSRFAPRCASVLGLDPRADTPEVEARLREVVAAARPGARAVAAAARHPARHRPARDARDGEPRRAVPAGAARGCERCASSSGPRRHGDDAGRRGRPVHRRGEQGPVAAAVEGRASLASTCSSSHTDPGSTWIASGRRASASLSLTLLRSRSGGIEIVRRATEDDPLSPHIVDEIARRSAGSALFLFELLEMVRATGPTDSLPDSVEAAIAGEIDRLSPDGPHDPPVRLGPRHDVRPPSFSRQRSRDDVELDEASGTGSRVSSMPMQTVSVGSATRSSGTRRTRDFPTGGGASSTRALARRSSDRRSIDRGGGLDARAPLLRGAAHDKAWSYGRRAGDAPRPWRRTSRRPASTSGPCRRRAGSGVSTTKHARTWISLSEVREAAGLFDASFEALRRATRLLRGNDVGRARVHANRSRAREDRVVPVSRCAARDDGGVTTRRQARRRRSRRGSLEPARPPGRDPLAPGPSAGGGRDRRGAASRREARVRSKRSRAPTPRSTAPIRCSGSPRRRSTSEALEIYTRLGKVRSLGITESQSRCPGVRRRPLGRCGPLVRSRAQSIWAGRAIARPPPSPGRTSASFSSVAALSTRPSGCSPRHGTSCARPATPFALFAETQLARSAIESGGRRRAEGAVANGRRGDRDRPAGISSRSRSTTPGLARRRRPPAGFYAAHRGRERPPRTRRPTTRSPPGPSRVPARARTDNEEAEERSRSACRPRSDQQPALRAAPRAQDTSRDYRALWAGRPARGSARGRTPRAAPRIVRMGSGAVPQAVDSGIDVRRYFPSFSRSRIQHDVTSPPRCVVTRWGSGEYKLSPPEEE